MNSAWPLITDIAKNVQSGRTSAQQYVEKSLSSIKDHKEYNATIATLENRALGRAKKIDELVKKGQEVGRLAGVPFIAKDNFLVFGGETTAGSNILKGFSSPYQSTAVELLEAQGAICVAKANLDAFGHGSSTQNSDFFVTKNAHDKTKVPGGSSGGSATSVALGLAPFALGTDTGGSNRQPASFSGCVGFKPTYGLVSRSGVVAMSSSMDTIGPLTSSVEDSAVVLDVISGVDPLDSTTVDRDVVPYTTFDKDLKGAKIGVVKEYFGEGVDEVVSQKIKECIKILEHNGAQIKEVSLPSLPLALACYYIICPAEISSNLSRYDGQRYGYSAKDAKTLEESYTLSRSIGFGKEAKRRIMIGTYVLSSGYYDAYYKKAQTLRTKIINEFDAVFGDVDFLVGPTTPTTAFNIGALADDPLAMYLSDILTVGANLAGIPAISVPCGTIAGLPIGLQLMSAQHKDRQLLSVANKTQELFK